MAESRRSPAHNPNRLSGELVESPAESHRIAGSFRDPSGYVFSRPGKIYRSLTPEAYGQFRELLPQRWFQELLESGRIVKSRLVDDATSAELARVHRNAAAFLEHDLLPWISYPAEWCYSMLADAAICTLDLQERMALQGFALKDASAYNVQFRRGQPVFIDLGSIERPKRADLWFALGQFNRMFLFPLMLSRFKGWDLRSYFLGALDGRNLEQVSRCFSVVDRARPSLWLDVWLPLWLERRHSRPAAAAHGALPSSGGMQAQLITLRRLRRKVAKLAAGYSIKSSWAEYERIRNYSDAAATAKRAVIAAFVEEHRPKQILDLGCNTGDFSVLAAQAGSRAIAVDADHDAIELLHRRVRSEALEVHPLVLDIATPTPGMGNCNLERTPFLERNRSDCVLALALIHHLHVSANLSLDAIAGLLERLTSRLLVLEFVPREDSMFERLIKFRVDLYSNYTLERCRAALTQRFVLLREQAIPGSARRLLTFQKRS